MKNCILIRLNEKDSFGGDGTWLCRQVYQSITAKNGICCSSTAKFEQKLGWDCRCLSSTRRNENGWKMCTVSIWNAFIYVAWSFLLFVFSSWLGPVRLSSGRTEFAKRKWCPNKWEDMTNGRIGERKGTSGVMFFYVARTRLVTLEIDVRRPFNKGWGERKRKSLNKSRR